MFLFLLVVAISTCLSFVSEFLAWVWVYRKAEFQGFSRELQKRKEQISAEKQQLEQTGKKVHAQRLKRFEGQYKELVQQMYTKSLKGQILPTVLALGGLPLLMPYLKGLVVAKLPFTPFWIFKSLTQQGLEDPGPNDCSATCIFFLAVAASRAIIRKCMPVPEIPSVFESLVGGQEDSQ
eukprot:Protomagalhaensia_wolfi_Nauph_80__6192@NODE_91_length_3802_cov_379_199309_g68_i0_p3_GENE_NODE_91_length_3802_cov_379_199309_g68_i0NODE_91_length_3802_cov_379_199309_g68_i0_p3_ORF_typecomplete_len179_score37_18EMC3_TMCO1/PF01956_16/2e25DUF2681/PF10883_8/0_076CAGE1/PF15066_6/0_19_NODE_91_length_3802_cov_379_199309_g68_i030033539